MAGWIKHMMLYVNGPSLYQVGENVSYSRNWLELVPDLYIKCMSTLTGIVKWTLPLWMSAAYRRGYFNREKLSTFIMLISGFTVTIVFAHVVRGLGRVANPMYRKFLDVLMKAENSAEMKELLIKYEFDFSAWPIDFDARREAAQIGRIKVQTPPCFENDTGIAALLSLPVDLAGLLLVRTLGIRMTYPGVVLSPLLRPALADARQKLIQEHGVQRVKLVTDSGIEIESLFADKRGTETPNKDMIVICCEGNAGYPEVGCVLVPLSRGYSVIGWNHPGFAGSTGMPYPHHEQEAIDAVVQFVKSRLGFEEHDIIFHGWSIGGYTASWAAMNYPHAKGVILDATFDNNEELSVNSMPAALSSFVRRTVRRNICLNVDHQLLRYPGPILLIRRTMDEIIATENRHVSSNRGNFLLINLLEYRYPKLMKPDAIAYLKRYLNVVSDAERNQILLEAGMDSAACMRILMEYESAGGDIKFPSKVGEDLSADERIRLTLFLATKYMQNFEATHCTPLKKELFSAPWSEHAAISNFVNGASNNSSGSDWERVDPGEQQ